MIDSRYEGDDIIVDNIGDVYHPKVCRFRLYCTNEVLLNATHNVCTASCSRQCLHMNCSLANWLHGTSLMHECVSPGGGGGGRCVG